MPRFTRRTLLILGLLFAQTAFAQTTTTSSPIPKQSSVVPNGARLKFRGVVISRDADVFTIRDRTRADYRVLITDNTSIKTRGGFLRSGKRYPVTDILRGLIVEVEGRGDAQGQLVADKIRFTESDMRSAQTTDLRVGPVEANMERMTGQMDELYAVAAEARAEVKTVNERVSALDDYDVQETVSITFRTNSAILSPEAKATLDALAAKTQDARAFMIEVAGHTDSTGSDAKNFRLSQARAEAVVQYLAVQHNIPLRRFVTPMGYGKTEAVADNTTAEGRSQNRRVDVKMVVNRGLANSQALPEFDWPPNASASMEIQRNLLIRAGATKSLKDIGDQLQEVLVRAGYGQGGFYGVPGGFALASRIEQFNKDTGAPLPGNDRWVIEIIRPPILSRQYLDIVLRARPSGSYRVVVFVVTNTSFSREGVPPTIDRAQVISLRGFNTLPNEFRRMPYSEDYTCNALIYEFRQTRSDIPGGFQTNSSLSAVTHLQAAGILEALRNSIR